MKFESLSSKSLPTKMDLEIVDGTGAVVFKKRQNIYYVKLQEKLATLDSAKDYVMTVTSMSGKDSTSDRVTIYNKHSKGKVGDLVLPEIMTALEEFTGEQCLEEAGSLPSVACVQAVKLSVVEDSRVKATRAHHGVVLKREDRTPSATPSLSDCEKIPEDSAASEDKESKQIKEESKTAAPVRSAHTFFMTKRLVLPVHVRYKWQRGFRKVGGSYAKVDFVKLELDYGTEYQFLPGALTISLSEAAPTIASAKHSSEKGTLYTCELTVHDIEQRSLSNNKLQVAISDVSGKDRRVTDSNKSCHVITEFLLCIDYNSKQAGGNWKSTDPVLKTSGLLM